MLECRQVIHLGYFQDEKEAAMAYDRALLEVRGPEYAARVGLNFPEGHTDTPGEHAEKLPGSQVVRQATQRLPITTQDAVDMAVKSIMTAYQAGQHISMVFYPLPPRQY